MLGPDLLGSVLEVHLERGLGLDFGGEVDFVEEVHQRYVSGLEFYNLGICKIGI